MTHDAVRPTHDEYVAINSANMIIAIDGPAGAGKSTIAKRVAKALGFLYIDTGAMYRALTFKSLEEKAPPFDQEAVIQLARKTTIDLRSTPNGSIQVLLDGKDVSSDIRLPRVSAHVSDVAKIKEVREIMIAKQQHLGRQPNSVMDGRDIGTVVFPQAEFKFYLDASITERARRRHEELTGMGQEVSLSAVEKDLSNRDHIDSTRVFAPLKRADDALYIDTTAMSIEEVTQTLLQVIHKHD